MINASTIIIFLQPTHLGESYKSIRFSGFFLVCVTIKTSALRQISKYSNSCFGELCLLSFRLKFLVKQPFNCYFDNNLLRIFCFILCMWRLKHCYANSVPCWGLSSNAGCSSYTIGFSLSLNIHVVSLKLHQNTNAFLIDIGTNCFASVA